MTYCNTADVRAYLDIDQADDDQLLEDLIEEAQKAIETYCNRIFEASADSTRYLDAIDDVDDLILYFDYDIASITTVKNNADNGSGGVTITSSQYITMPRNTTPYYAIKLLSSTDLYWDYTDDSEAGIEITGKWAYSESAPDDIKRACIRWASYLYRQKDAQVYDVTAIPDAGVITIPAGIPADVKRLLNPYRRHV
jgi:hypothetical protein